MVDLKNKTKLVKANIYVMIPFGEQSYYVNFPGDLSPVCHFSLTMTYRLTHGFLSCEEFMCLCFLAGEHITQL